MITKEKAEQIIALAEGMTHAEWSRINHIVVTGFETQVLLALPAVGLVAYLLGTVFTELGLYGVLELMNSIEDAREE